MPSNNSRKRRAQRQTEAKERQGWYDALSDAEKEARDEAWKKAHK